MKACRFAKAFLRGLKVLCSKGWCGRCWKLTQHYKILLIFIITIILYSCTFPIKREIRKSRIYDVFRQLQFEKPANASDGSHTQWVYMGSQSLRHQIYSAYYDTRLELLYDVSFSQHDVPYGSVRVFAALPLHMSTSIYCSLKYDAGTLHEVLAVEALPIHEHWDLPYAVYSIVCPVSRKEGNVAVLPSAVALLYGDNPATFMVPTYIPINYPSNDQFAPRKKAIHACVGPLQLNYNETLRLVEFIEVYKLLGVEQLHFHLLNATENIISVLDYYKAKNIAKVHEWNFHGYKFEKEIRYGGIMAEFNDCVYRSTFVDQVEYVAVVDVDEILMPLKNFTLLDLLSTLDDGHVSEFMFRNVFFAGNSPNDSSSQPEGVKNKFLYTQVKFERSKESYIPRSRSKYIAKGIAAVEMGNHNMWRWIAGYKPIVLDPQVGLSFHYRRKCINCKEARTVDLSARRFGSVLWRNVDKACREIFNNGICPL